MRKILLILFLLITTPVFADEYCIGQWVWNDGTDGLGNIISSPYWEAPNKNLLTGVIDLRSLPNQALAGGTPQGQGIFIYSSDPGDASLTCIGNKDLIISSATRTIIQNKLGISGTTATTLKDLIYEILSLKGDPTGNSRWKPLMPEMDGHLRLRGGINDGILKTVKLIPFKSPEWQYVLATLQEDYRRKLNIEPDHQIAKWLDKLQEEYGVPYETFIPDGVFKIASLPHHTSISDDFDTANSATLGHLLTWTDLADDEQNSSNAASLTTSGAYHLGYSREGTDLSSSNNYAQASTPGEFADTGWALSYLVMSRFSSSSNQAYGTKVDQSSSAATINVIKDVSGTITSLGSASISLMVAGDIIKSQSNGSTINAYINGVSKVTVTDTAITSGTRAGLGTANDSHNNNGHWNAQLDNFSAADLAVVATVTPKNRILF